MAKRHAKPPVVISRNKFLLPKMEWFTVDETTGEGFFLRELGGEGLTAFLDAVNALKKQEGGEAELQPHQAFNLMAKFVVLSACDEKGHSIFTDEDIPLIASKNPNLILDIANKAMPLSGLNPDVIGEVAVDLKNDLQNSSATDLPTS